jgi:NADPH:quinone reductase-like Zn-dependent oxidoreductase
MIAIRQNRLGGPEVLEPVEVDRPSPAPTEVLVRVTGAGVNPVDFKTRTRGGMLGEPPFVLGWDIAGVVEEAGFGVTRFQPGDRVFGMPAFPHEAGAYAEYAAARSRELARIPDNVTDEEAAALPLAGLTAWQALVDTAQIGEGTRVLIHAAAGGVGHLAVQIAKASGAYVIGTARATHHEWLKTLGADELIDYTTEPTDEADVDVILDLVGGDVGLKSLPSLRDGGLIINIPSGSDLVALQEAAGDRVRVTGLLVEPDRVGMEALAQLAGDGLLKVKLAKTFPLAEAGAAHALLERGDAGGGKLVLVP